MEANGKHKKKKAGRSRRSERNKSVNQDGVQDEIVTDLNEVQVQDLNVDQDQIEDLNVVQDHVHELNVDKDQDLNADQDQDLNVAEDQAEKTNVESLEQSFTAEDSITTR